MAKKPKIVEDVNVEKKKKEHSALKTFILVILIGGACFFVGAYYQDIFESFSVAPIKEDGKKESDNEETIDDCVTMEEDELPDSVKEIESIEKALERYYYFTTLDKGFSTPEEIDLNDLLLFATSMNISEMNKAHNGFDISLKQVNKILKKYFDYEIEEGADIFCDICTETTYLYDKENKIFTYNWDSDHAHSGSAVNVKQRIISAKTNENNEVIVQVKQAFGLGEYVVTEYYDSLEDAEKEVNPILKVEYDPEDMFFDEYDFNNVSNDKMYTYEYVFKEIDGILVLKSYKKL